MTICTDPLFERTGMLNAELGAQQEAAEMSRRRGGEEGGASYKRRSRRRPRKQRDARRDWGEGEDVADTLDRLDESLLSPDEHAYRAARNLAEEKAEIYLDSGKAGAVVLLLLFLLPPVGFIGLIWWGFRHGRNLFRMMVEPGLRERLIEEEVRRHVNSNIGRERRGLAGEHARSLEVLSASIAHEIRNPITAAKSLLQQINEEPDSLDNPEYAQVALVELERVERSIHHLLRYGREEELRRSRVSLCEVLDSALETFRERAERDAVVIDRQFDCEGVIDGDADKLRRIAINLIGNAMDVLSEARVDAARIEVAMGENLAGNEVWMRVRDNGPGIDEETRKQIFTPFFTARRGGTGLGLAITKKLVEAHQGEIEVRSEPGIGAEFVVRFPKIERRSAAVDGSEDAS